MTSIPRIDDGDDMTENEPEDLSPEQATSLLDAIPGAWESAQEGLEDARAGRTIPLDELVGDPEEAGADRA